MAGRGWRALSEDGITPAFITLVFIMEFVGLQDEGLASDGDILMIMMKLITAPLVSKLQPGLSGRRDLKQAHANKHSEGVAETHVALRGRANAVD